MAKPIAEEYPAYFPGNPDEELAHAKVQQHKPMAVSVVVTQEASTEKTCVLAFIMNGPGISLNNIKTHGSGPITVVDLFKVYGPEARVQNSGGVDYLSINGDGGAGDIVAMLSGVILTFILLENTHVGCIAV